MKIQLSLRYLIITLLPLALIACQSDTEPSHNYPENARLIRVLHYHGLESAQEDGTLVEYEYDKEGRLIRTAQLDIWKGERSEISTYDAYEYDSDNRLVKKASFNLHSNGGFINSKNVFYTYDSRGNQSEETIEYPEINLTEQILFYHDGYGRLILKEQFDSNNASQGYHVFEYNTEGQLIMEKIHNAQQVLMRKHVHQYQNGNNTGTEVFVGDSEELL